MTLEKGGRYDVSQLLEAQCQPGSRGRVLKNLPGITRKREMDRDDAREQLLERIVSGVIRRTLRIS